MQDKIADLFSRHERVALSLSGGKDSLVCLHLFLPWIDRVDVYWMNPGNPFPETVEFMRGIAAAVPSFKEVRGYQPEIIAQDGWPSDVVPHRHTTDGNLIFGETPFKVQTRVSCCFRALMVPMYEAMKADGVTCVVRGKRREEADRTGLEDGHISEDGIELSFPILDWTAAEVFAYIAAHDIQLPAYYEHAKHSLDCMDCTAWWGEGLSEYLKHKHPEAFVEYRRRIHLIKQAIAEQMADCEV
jgi:phosphoadenosine phosphosulfate reductase